nr:putative glutamine amidotransferase-like protein c13c5.04 [Quercus suber]
MNSPWKRWTVLAHCSWGSLAQDIDIATTNLHPQPVRALSASSLHLVFIELFTAAFVPLIPASYEAVDFSILELEYKFAYLHIGFLHSTYRSGDQRERQMPAGGGAERRHEMRASRSSGGLQTQEPSHHEPFLDATVSNSRCGNAARVENGCLANRIAKSEPFYRTKPSKTTPNQTFPLQVRHNASFGKAMGSTPASAPLRVAVLEADTPVGRTKEKYGGYGNLFKELLEKGVARVRQEDGAQEVPELEVTKFDVVDTEVYPDLDTVDAVLISGSSGDQRERQMPAGGGAERRHEMRASRSSGGLQTQEPSHHEPFLDATVSNSRCGNAARVENGCLANRIAKSEPFYRTKPSKTTPNQTFPLQVRHNASFGKAMGSTPASAPLRVAVLEADTPVGRTKEKYGGYGNLFKELLEKGVARVRQEDGAQEVPELEVTKFDVVDTEVYPDLDTVDAVLISGSKWNSFDNDPWILRLVAFTERVLAQERVRLIGVCFGHQIIGRAMKTKVDRSNRGWEISVVPVTLTAKGKELFRREDLRIHQMHRDIVYAYPLGVEALGHTDRCEVQGMYQRARLISVQGHPEFSAPIVQELLERRHEQGILDDAMFQDGMSRVENEHDGVAISAAFIRFLLEGR